jgi:predicted RNA-binding Zn-ribbon protein involved in translation (DUF1610 family)
MVIPYRKEHLAPPPMGIQYCTVSAHDGQDTHHCVYGNQHNCAHRCNCGYIWDIVSVYPPELTNKHSCPTCGEEHMWNKENRDNFRVVRCEQCPDWFQAPGKARVKAHTLASRHAKKFPGHEAVVIDLNLLKIEHRYTFETLFDDAEPPF